MRSKVANQIPAAGCGHGVPAKKSADPLHKRILAHTLPAAENNRHQGLLVRPLDQMRKPAGEPISLSLVPVADVLEKVLFPPLDHRMIRSACGSNREAPPQIKPAWIYFYAGLEDQAIEVSATFPLHPHLGDSLGLIADLQLVGRVHVQE